MIAHPDFVAAVRKMLDARKDELSAGLAGGHCSSFDVYRYECGRFYEVKQLRQDFDELVKRVNEG